MFIDFLTKYIVLLQNLVNEIRKCNPFPSEHVSIWYLFFEPHQTTHQSILGVRLRKVTELHPTYLIFANCVLFYFASGLGRASIFFDLLWFVCRFKCGGNVLLYLGMRVHVVICVQVLSDVCLHLIIISPFCNLVVGCWQWIMQSCSKWGYGVCREACKGGSGSERVGLLSSDPITYCCSWGYSKRCWIFGAGRCQHPCSGPVGSWPDSFILSLSVDETPVLWEGIPCFCSTFLKYKIICHESFSQYYLVSSIRSMPW